MYRVLFCSAPKSLSCTIHLHPFSNSHMQMTNGIKVWLCLKRDASPILSMLAMTLARQYHGGLMEKRIFS